MQENSDTQYWLGLLKIPHIGSKRCLQIWEKTQAMEMSLAAFWKLSETKLRKLNLDSQAVNSFVQSRTQIDPPRLLDEILRREISLVTVDSELYPHLLKHLPDPPPVLFYKGTPNWNQQPLLGVVGTRHITGYGKLVTRRLTKEIVHAGYGVVSGGMYGVDMCAHHTAIENCGFTVAVLGFGFDYVYPKTIEQQNFLSSIVESGGALVTEFFPDQEPVPGKFPQRNRIVAGMSLGILVTEAASKSGSKITAQYAGEYGREVFSVPGVITSKYSEGTKDLINNGAKLVTSVEDILAEFPHSKTTPSTQNAPTQLKMFETTVQIEDKTDREILIILTTQGESSLSELEFNFPDIEIVELMQHLSNLELDGWIINEGGVYRISEKSGRT